MGSRRYDSRTTIFSPEGRLYQVSLGAPGVEGVLLESLDFLGQVAGLAGS